MSLDMPSGVVESMQGSARTPSPPALAGAWGEKCTRPRADVGTRSSAPTAGRGTRRRPAASTAASCATIVCVRPTCRCFGTSRERGLWSLIRQRINLLFILRTETISIAHQRADRSAEGDHQQRADRISAHWLHTWRPTKWPPYLAIPVLQCNVRWERRRGTCLPSQSSRGMMV